MKDKTMTIKELTVLVGGLGQPSKMPCYSYSISNKNCITGSKLKLIEGSTCHRCYANRGNYNWPTIKDCYSNRLDKMMNDPNWVPNMSALINKTSDGYFRWFDSGDLQSVKNLADIVQIAVNTPTTQHWLPTREYGIVSEFIKAGGVIPSNITLRLSAYKIEGKPPTSLANRLGVLTSTVTKGDGYNCVASSQESKCLDCRRCWDKSIPNISYKYH
jgi:hypothetical protein